MQNNNNHRNYSDKLNPSDKAKIEDKEFWRNEHGRPDFGYLEALAKDGRPRVMEKLRSIAKDLNVKFNNSTSTEELIAGIRLAVKQSDNEATN